MTIELMIAAAVFAAAICVGRLALRRLTGRGRSTPATPKSAAPRTERLEPAPATLIPEPERERMYVAVDSCEYVDPYRGPDTVTKGVTRVTADWLEDHPECAHCFDAAVWAPSWDAGGTATRITLPSGETVAGEDLPEELPRNQG